MVGTREMKKSKKTNGAIEVSASILPLVAISVAEAEMGGAFYNCKKGKVFRLTLDEMGFKSRCPYNTVNIQIYLVN